ncbi:MAG: class I SAM-dependent methyltransferase [Bacteroidetes bacterium]|nr:class I SAM-dependent methyltransferase [Bacteroidota bacterium]
MSRNYSTISPSARALLLMKGLTPIPFARQAAELIEYPTPYVPDYSVRMPGLWARVVHFEVRYLSINQLMPAEFTNILELSSGFSFRGLALADNSNVYYIDTDLPELIETKTHLVTQLLAASPGTPIGHYELRPLNALDEEAFNAVIDSFPEGPLLIVNEGLLMYLGVEEKQRLCGLIRRALLKRGGYWITADVYIKRSRRVDDPELALGDTLKQFLEQHKVDDNMFNSFDEAREFFSSMGFVIDKEAEPDYSSVTSLPHFLASASPGLLTRLRQHPTRMHMTWRLKAIPS